MYKFIKLSALSLFVLSCSYGHDYKFISTSFTDFCISEDEDYCVKAINDRCKSNYLIDSMQKYEYYIDSDKIIIKFKCKEKNG